MRATLVVSKTSWQIHRAHSSNEGEIIASCTSRAAVEAAWRLLLPGLPIPEEVLPS